MRSIVEKLGIPAPAQLPETGKQQEDVFSLKLETPMYGGGAKAGDADSERPVRVPSVRGNLRFWWRMLFAKGLKGKELREKESAIWGSTETPSSVFINVDCAPWNRFRKHEAAEPFGFQKYGAEAYALFPAMPQRQKNIAGHDILEEKMTFTLRLAYSEPLGQDAISEVRAALAAWIYFGGLGARTRRGLGTLSCEKAELCGGGKLPGLKEILTMNKDITLWTRSPRKSAALDAWHDALDVYKSYRQNRNPGQQRRPGRSRWPEPDSLRKLTGQHDPRHAKPITGPLPSFPRAALGLPIIFHFIDRSDPKDVQLKGTQEGADKAAERMASPVITKAIFDGSAWRSAVVILPRKDALRVTPAPDICGAGDSNIIGVQDSHYIKAQYQPTQGADNAIEGFEIFIRNQGFKEGV